MFLFLGKNLEAETEASAQQAWYLIRLFRVMKPRLSNCLHRKLCSPLLDAHCLSPVSTQILHYKVCIFCIKILNCLIIKNFLILLRLIPTFSCFFRCLDGQGWNIEQARNAFLAAKQKNEIPEEAFS